MTIQTVEPLRVPLYETQILSKKPEQLLDWARDLVQSLQIWSDQITDATNQQLNQDNSDATYWGSIDGNGEWVDGTWRMIKIADDDFQLQKRVSGTFVQNAGWSHD